MANPVLAAAALLLVGGLAACSQSSTEGQCLMAFRNAEPRALPAYGVSPLDDAVRSCSTVAEWQAAWDAVPAAHEGRTDAMGVLADRCAVATLAQEAICRELAGTR
ncbi:MAG TPA: hypothetical protein VFX65_13355 [Candidatus Limnocylindrales bacterium]|nr:hypothetical protein [Candidatus Limnocylindrales bacterium]